MNETVNKIVKNIIKGLFITVGAVAGIAILKPVGEEVSKLVIGKDDDDPWQK